MIREREEELAGWLKEFVLVQNDGSTKPVLNMYGDFAKAEIFVNSPREQEAAFKGFDPSAFTAAYLDGANANFGPSVNLVFDGCLFSKTREGMTQLLEQLLNKFGMPSSTDGTKSHWRLYRWQAAEMVGGFHVTGFTLWYVIMNP
jgi:hypothetical protein